MTASSVPMGLAARFTAKQKGFSTTPEYGLIMAPIGCVSMPI